MDTAIFSTTWRVTTLAAFALLIAGCDHTNANYCCTDLATCHLPGGSDDLVACTDPARPFCDNSGEVGGLARTCIPDPSTSACDGPQDCTSPLAPLCMLPDPGTCGGCQGPTDCARFPELAVCNTESGACVECVESSDCTTTNEPICGADNTCHACTNDNECDSGVCIEATGSCLDDSEIVYVATNGSGASCTRAQPCGTLAAGIVAVDATRTTILLAPGSYVERVSVTAKSFTILGQGANLSAAVAGEVFDINAGNVSVTIDGLRIHNGLGVTGDGIRCRDMGGNPTITLRGVIIEDNGGAGINASRCNVTVERSRIIGNNGGGITTAASGAVAVRNNFIVKNGEPTATVGGASFGTPTSLAFEFNTVADNVTTVGFAAGVQCTSAAPVTLANNIIFGAPADQVSGTNCGFAYTMSNETIPGTGNRTDPPSFVNAATNDYHLTLSSPGINAADPAATLATDIDGQPRPQGGRSDMGADETQT